MVGLNKHELKSNYSCIGRGNFSFYFGRELIFFIKSNKGILGAKSLKKS